MQKLNLSGKRFGKWTVLSISADGLRRSIWNCVCDCGKKKKVSGTNLNRGISKSCGCIRMETCKRLFTKHGHTSGSKNGIKNYTNTYKKWRAMLMRCTNKKHQSYHFYGGRGITFQKSWSDYSEFLKEMGECQPGYSLDRINSNKSYSKNNCRWVPLKQQKRNRRDCIWVNVNKSRVCLSEACEIIGISYDRVWIRMKSGMSFSEAVESVCVKFHTVITGFEIS